MESDQWDKPSSVQLFVSLWLLETLCVIVEVGEFV